MTIQLSKKMNDEVVIWVLVRWSVWVMRAFRLGAAGVGPEPLAAFQNVCLWLWLEWG